MAEKPWEANLDRNRNRAAKPWEANLDRNRRGARTDDALGTITTLNKSLPFLSELADAGQAVSNVVTGRARGIGEGWQQARGQSREAAQGFEERRPRAAALIRGMGLAASALIPGGQTAQASRAGAAALGGATAAAQAGLYAAGTGEGTLQQRGQRALNAMADPATWALGGAAGSLGVPRRELPQRPVRESVRTLAAEGVQMTPGQVAGGVARRVEEGIQRVPFVGQPIRRAQRQSIESFNLAAANRALSPIGARVPEGVAAGNEAVDFAQRAIGGEYDRLLPSVTIQPDQQLVQELGAIQQQLQFMTPDRAAQLERILDQRITSRIANRQAITGQEYQQIRSELGNLARGYGPSADMDQRQTAEALRTVIGALDNAVARQNPAVGASLQNANRAYANLAQLETAAAKNPVGGVVTPRQMGTAVRQTDRSVRKRATAAGNAMNQDFVTAAQDVLPATMPDSGTPEGAMMGALALGTVAPPVLATGLVGAATTNALYSPQALALFNRALNNRIAREQQIEALQQLGLLASQDPKLRSLYAEASQRLARASGATAGYTSAASASTQ